jgi:hypothetical protein
MLSGKNISIIVTKDHVPSPAWIWIGEEKSIFITEDILASDLPFSGLDPLYAILCHELGHLESSMQYPNLFDGTYSMAPEGEADYYQTSICLRKLFKESLVEDLSPPPIKREVKDSIATEIKVINQKCRVAWSNDVDHEVCLRSAIASFKAMKNAQYRYFNFYLEKIPVIEMLISFSRVSLEEVNQTLTGYPSGQCRLDTILAGALNKQRPNCWFRSMDRLR